MKGKKLYIILVMIVLLIAAGIYAGPRLSKGKAEPADASELTAQDREKIDNWKYRPDDTIYLKYKEVFDNPKYYNQETGEINWPPNDGAVDGTQQIITLEEGTQIDRYGTEDGYYTTPINTPYEERSCAPGSEEKPYYQYEVTKPIENVEQSVTAPWFDQPGGGLQYLMPESVGDLVQEGFLERIEE